MGCWMGASGRLTIVPEPDKDLMMEYADFSKHVCPKGYRKDEVFSNPWYFDECNRLASCIGKFAEPSVWYRCIKEEFFEPRGYHLYGDPLFVGEGELDIWELGEKRRQELQLWQKRLEEMRAETKTVIDNIG